MSNLERDVFRSAVILAGGKSSRMEFDKQFLLINKQRLIYNVAKNLSKEFKDIIIVSNKKECYIDSEYKVISDSLKDMGPLAGISVGLEESSSEYVYIIACDMPNIDYKYIQYLKNKICEDKKNKNEKEVYISKINERTQLFQGFYKKSLSKEIEEYLLNGRRKSIISFFENRNKHISYIEDKEFIKNKFREDIFINLNTKEDLNLYKKGI